MKKHFIYGNNKVCNVELKKTDYMWVVLVDGEVYAKEANELFAVRIFNAI